MARSGILDMLLDNPIATMITLAGVMIMVVGIFGMLKEIMCFNKELWKIK